MSIKFSAKPMAFAVALIATGGLLSACGGGSSDGPRIQVSPANAYLLTSQNRIIGVDLDDTEYARSVIAIAQNTLAPTPTATTGYSINALDIGEQVLAIDYRNSEGLLYALTRSGSEERVVIIDPTTGFIARRGTITPSLSDVSFTIDFNPVNDTLRAIGSDNTNYSITITSNTAATAEGAPAPTATSTKDTNIVCNSDSSCNTPFLGSAYTDEGPKTSTRSTRLFGLDKLNTYALTANAGTVTTVRSLGVTSISTVNGYDINPANNQGVAIFTIDGALSIYAIDSTLGGSGNAATKLTSLPSLPSPETYIGLSLVTGANPTVP